MQQTRYIGDLSPADEDLLCDLSGTHSRIVEFGVGASTQILCDCAQLNAWIESVETDPAWVDRTVANLERLGICRRPDFATWECWLLAAPRVIDLAIDDGRDDLRDEFARRVWPMIRPGGLLLWHDCRVKHVNGRIHGFAHSVYDEVKWLKFSPRGSNMAVIKKRRRLVYENWNENARLNAGHVAIHPRHLGMTKDELLKLREQMEAK